MFFSFSFIRKSAFIFNHFVHSKAGADAISCGPLYEHLACSNGRVVVVHQIMIMIIHIVCRRSELFVCEILLCSPQSFSHQGSNPNLSNEPGDARPCWCQAFDKGPGLEKFGARLICHTNYRPALGNSMENFAGEGVAPNAGSTCKCTQIIFDAGAATNQAESESVWQLKLEMEHLPGNI